MKAIMLQGTGSHVGKSILTTALCRIFLQDGLRPVPFKAQNMALNSYVTKDGGEMGRAQVAQAEAAGLEPTVDMNPILLKPTGNATSQVIVLGKPVATMGAKEYHSSFAPGAIDIVEASARKLAEQYDALVIEGAGSPAEINLKDSDIVNMRVAKLLQAPVLLVADIDRGGVIASLVGTMELLDPDERALVKGFIINKFRGDVSLLQPALDFLEQKTGKPVLGVIPHMPKLDIDDEDSVSLDDKKGDFSKELDIAVIRLPKISNFTDFEALDAEPDASVRYVNTLTELGDPDLIILPGSKNTTEDLLHLKESGLETAIVRKNKAGTPVIGICGGYQMLGQRVDDPQHTESTLDGLAGIGLLPTSTVFLPDKITHQVQVRAAGHDFLSLDYTADALRGYEIHMGRTSYLAPVRHAFMVDRGDGAWLADGVIRDDGLVMGSYIHGIFDNDEYRRQLLNSLRARKGLDGLQAGQLSMHARKEAAYDRLADTVRRHLDLSRVYAAMGVERA